MFVSERDYCISFSLSAIENADCTLYFLFPRIFHKLAFIVVIGQEDSTTLYNSMSTKREIERAIILMKLWL